MDIEYLIRLINDPTDIINQINQYGKRKDTPARDV